MFVCMKRNVQSNLEKRNRVRIFTTVNKLINKKIKHMYSLDCSYYKREFNNVNDLINDVIVSGMDPNYEITFNGMGTTEMAIDFIVG